MSFPREVILTVSADRLDFRATWEPPAHMPIEGSARYVREDRCNVDSEDQIDALKKQLAISRVSAPPQQKRNRKDHTMTHTPEIERVISQYAPLLANNPPLAVSKAVCACMGGRIASLRSMCVTANLPMVQTLFDTWALALGAFDLLSDSDRQADYAQATHDLAPYEATLAS